MALATGTSRLLGPLTTTWTQPPACSIAVGACSTCYSGWQAQTCGGNDTVRDAPSCWPPRTLGAMTPPQPLFAWGIYSPGLVCPQGYATACSYNGAKKTGDFNFYFSPQESETVVGCCPSGYGCSRHAAGQTCITTLTSTTVPTVTCESGTSAHFEYVSIPYAVADVSTMKIISTFTVLAPLFQLNYQASDLPSTTEEAIRTSTNSIASTSTLQGLPPQTSPAEASNRPPGLSTGAQAAIGCGITLGIIISVTIAFFLFRSKRRKILSQPIELQSDDPKRNELKRDELQMNELQMNGLQMNELQSNEMQSYEHEGKFRMDFQAQIPAASMRTGPFGGVVEPENNYRTNQGPYQPPTRPFNYL